MDQPRTTLHAKDGKPLPIYFRLQDLLLRDIENGRLAPGSTVPPERKLAESCGVSIGTVKKAILNLVNKGYLYRIQGKGTFVAGTTLRRESLRYYRFLGNFADEEKALSVHVIGIRKLPRPKDGRTYPGFHAPQDFFELKRLFLFQDTPIIFTVSYLPVGLFRGIDQIPASHFEQKTLFAIIEEKFGLPTISNKELIGMVVPPKEAARILKIPEKQAVLFIEMLSFTYKDQPYEYRRAYCLTGALKILRRY